MGNVYAETGPLQDVMGFAWCYDATQSELRGGKEVLKVREVLEEMLDGNAMDPELRLSVFGVYERATRAGTLEIGQALT